jgi:hypothetical protein
MTTRFLLSHNYNITADQAPALSSEEFCAAFQSHMPSALMASGLNIAPTTCLVRPIDHPHWRCEIVVAADPQAVNPQAVNPQSVGIALAQALRTYRTTPTSAINYQILALGGLKTTPATSSSPAALQPGEWGVDVVETIDAGIFLQTLGWEKLSADKPTSEIFQVIA